MTAAAIACLTVYDMVKSVDRAVSIGPIVLKEKSGGKSGEFRRET
jgi:cyclic pyranopterin phosphate synthase